MKIQVLAAVVVAVAAIGYIGFQVKPARFTPFPQSDGVLQTVPIPEGLPESVDSYYRQVYGEEIPVVESFVVTGRGRIRPFGLWMPARFRFTHIAGKGYRHYIEATWFGLPIMKVDEHFVEGRGVMAMPWGESGGSEIEQAMNVSLWAELSSAAPSVFLTDGRAEWQHVDDETAILKVPRASGSAVGDAFVVRFGPGRAHIESMEALRFKASGDERKVPWKASSVGDASIGRFKLPAVGAATWADDGKPWAYFETEDIRYNVDVDEYIRARGL